MKNSLRLKITPRKLVSSTTGTGAACIAPDPVVKETKIMGVICDRKLSLISHINIVVMPRIKMLAFLGKR